jgi:uncharacterized spore protein YtfJ
VILRLHQVVQKNGGGIGGGISVQPNSPIVVQHRPTRVLGQQECRQNDDHQAANKLTPFKQKDSSFPYKLLAQE